LGQGVALHEWEVPFSRLPGRLAGQTLREPPLRCLPQRPPADAGRDGPLHRRGNADNETLYDQPEKSKNKLRITGPFTVEAVPFPTVLSLDAAEPQGHPQAEFTCRPAVARSGATNASSNGATNC
jgi:adenine-specific DNA-methyltransferase